MKNLKAVIVDDEFHSSETLKWELERSCPNVEVIATFNLPLEAAIEIPKLQIDILFLDVEMPKMSGFDLLHTIGTPDFGVVFTTAYDEFALKAIKHSAIDYLLKPIDPNELKAAMDKLAQVRSKQLSDEQLAVLFEKVESKKNNFGKMALPSSNGLIFVEPSKVVYCQSDGNYTDVHFEDDKKHVISKSLKEIESILEGHGFLRVHNSYIVNVEHIAEYVKSDGGYLVLDNGAHISVSRARKEALIGLFS